MKLKKQPGAEEAQQAQKRKPKNCGKRCIHFEFVAPPGSEIFVAGEFNDWEKASLRLSDRGHPGVFRRNIYVDPGRFEYKFFIDGEWHIDPNCTRWRPNQFGSLNSVVEV